MTLDILVGVTSILEQHTASIVMEENGDSMFLQNIGNHIPGYTFSTQKTVPRILASTFKCHILVIDEKY
jgi:hypothetical protein